MRNPEPSKGQIPNLKDVPLPSTDAKELLRSLLLECKFDSVDLWPLFGKEIHPSFVEIADSVRKLLFAEGIARTRPLQRVSLDFITLHAQECALHAEQWGAAWGQWLNEKGDNALHEWSTQINDILQHYTEETLISHPEIIFVSHIWLAGYEREILEVQEKFSLTSRELFLKMHECGISPESLHLRNVVDRWGPSAYGLINKSTTSLVDGFTPEEIDSIQKIIDLLDQFDQSHLLPDLFLRLSPPHYREHAAIFYQALSIDPAKALFVLELFPTTQRLNVQDLALNALRYGGPAAKETLARVGLPKDEFIPELNHLIYHSGVFGYQALRYRLQNVLAKTQDAWLPELHRYGHGFWALMAKFKTNLLEEISNNRSFIDEIYPLCTSGAGRFLHNLPLSLWNKDGVLLADIFRECAGDVWSELKEDSLDWATNSRFSALRTTLIEKGRIRGLHRYIPFGKSGDARFDLLNKIADRLEDTRKNSTAKKSAQFFLAGTDPLNSFGGTASKRIFQDLLQNFDLTVQEVRSKTELAQSLYQINLREDEMPVPLTVIAAHGDSYGMQFGGLRHMLPCPADGTKVSFQNYLSIRDRELVRSWKQFFSANCDVALLSCSNFLEGPSSGGFGRMLQEELFPAAVHGMRRNMVPLKIDFDEDARVRGILGW